MTMASSHVGIQTNGSVVTSSGREKSDFLESLRAPMSYQNWVRDLHPATLAFVLLSMTVLSLSRSGLLWPAITCTAFVMIAFVAGVGRVYLLTYGRLALVAGTILFVARSAVLPGKTILFQFGGLKISTESILAAGQFTLTVLTICGAVILLFTLAPIKKIVLSLEQSGVTPKATFIMLSSTQSILNLGKHTRAVSDAQESRGVELKGSVPRRIKAFFAIISPVFLTGLNQVEERALALDARAFNSGHRHTQLVQIRHLRAGEFVAIIVSLLAAALSLIGALTSWF